VHVEIDVMLEKVPLGSTGVFLASQFDTGGCWAMYANGFHYWISVDTKTAKLTGNQSLYLGLPLYHFVYNISHIK